MAGYRLADVHRSLEADVLTAAGVPERLRDHYETCRNLILYSWFVYRFVPVAQLHLYSCLEFALRVRLGRDDDEKPPTFEPLLSLAKQQGVFDGVYFRTRHEESWPPIRKGNPEDSDAEWFFDVMAKYLRYFRNNLAHGSITLMPDGGIALRVVCDAVNHLFRAA